MPQFRSSTGSTGSTSDEDLVAHMKLTNGAKYTALVNMHLSFLLDLSGTCLSELIEDRIGSSTGAAGTSSTQAAESSESRPSFASVFSRKRQHKDHLKQSAMFGQPLSQNSIERIGLIVDYLGQPENIKQEGLFRKAGHVDRQRVLCDRLKGEQCSLGLSDFTVHDCATALKTFLGDMPEPLLIERYCTAYRQVAEMQSDLKRLQAIQLLIQLLPTEHATLLRQLLNLLHRVDADPENRMTADNLAILFVPHIIVPRKTPTIELQQTYASFTGLVSFMISHAEQLFSFPEPLTRDVCLYYHCGGHDGTPGSLSDDETTSLASFDSANKQPGCDSDDEVIITSIGFADRQASQLAAVQFDTAKAIADLYAHVSQMPDSANKRRLMKQFNKSMNAGTPSSITSCKRRNLSAFTRSIKRIINKRHRGNNATADESLTASCQQLSDVRSIGIPVLETPQKRLNMCTCETPASASETPVRNLFGSDAPANTDHCTATTKLPSDDSHNEKHDRLSRLHLHGDPQSRHNLTHRASSKRMTACSVSRFHSELRDSGVTDLGDFDEEDDGCLSDKENTVRPVFPFHPTASVVAMERIFAKQRLPTYVRPKGYISPLRCPSFLLQSINQTAPAVTVSSTAVAP